MLAELLLKWPLIRQLKTGTDGTGAEAMSDATKELKPKNAGAEVARSICPYCGVGCGQLVYHRDGKVISIEGDPQSPISRGHLCPKGANSHELVTHAGRAMRVKYLPHEQAMQMVADRLWESRNRTYDPRAKHSTGVAHLGGATLDNEENYLIK